MKIQRILVRSGRGFRDMYRVAPSDKAFERRFGTERACRDFLFAHRWPRGFVCHRCGPAGHRWVDERRLVCLSCHKVRSVTGGTILERTRKPLTLWFRAAFLMAQHGASARTLQEDLGVTYKIAWTWAHKLRRLMALKTTVDEAVPSFVPDPHLTAVAAFEGDPRLIENKRRQWYVLHGGYEWEASRSGGLGACCARFDHADWDADDRTLGWSKQRFFEACSGSVSDKHIETYMRQTEWRMNHRGLSHEARTAELMGRFAATRPVPYRAIRGERPPRAAVRLAWRGRLSGPRASATPERSPLANGQRAARALCSRPREGI
ncbi:MAG: transposase [Planctomycetota bacterium]